MLEDLLGLIESRRKFGLMSTFFSYLSEPELTLLQSEGYDIVQTGEGYYVYC